MSNRSAYSYKALPKEYRKLAETLFLDGCDYLAFADKLGVGTYFRKLDLDWKNQEQLDRFLHSFRNNLELLIQKTWVEKVDENRKETLLDLIPDFIDLVKQEDYAKALKEFRTILEEIAWLLFGSQSIKDDFLDYVIRIDDQLGLFWWYSDQLEHFLSTGQKETETLRALLFLGLCYLTDF